MEHFISLGIFGFSCWTWAEISIHNHYITEPSLTFHPSKIKINGVDWMIHPTNPIKLAFQVYSLPGPGPNWALAEVSKNMGESLAVLVTYLMEIALPFCDAPFEVRTLLAVLVVMLSLGLETCEFLIIFAYVFHMFLYFTLVFTIYIYFTRFSSLHLFTQLFL